MRQRKRLDTQNEYDAFEERRNTTLLTRNYNLLEWTDSLEIGTPNLLIPSQIAEFVGSSPFCRFAVSPKADRVAIINFNRVLNVYALDGDACHQESSVQVLEDEFPEYCQIQYTECGNLLLSTRSSAQIDVFDQSGGYCYDIPLQDTPSVNIDLMCAVSCLQTAVNSTASADDRFLDWLYVLQYNGTFSVYKIGRLARYIKLWSVPLNIGLVSSFVLLREYNLLLVGAHYQATGETSPAGGLCSFRLIDSEPHLDPIRTVNEQNSWFSFFSASNMAFISSLSLSLSVPKQLVAVSTSGDVLLYDIPSTALVVCVKYVSGPKPCQAVFVDENEIVVAFQDGSLVRCSQAELEESVTSCSSSDSFSGRIALSTPRDRELFLILEKGGHREVVNRRTFFAFRLWMYTLWSSFKQLVGMAVGDAAAPLQMAKHSDSFNFELWYQPTRTLQQLLDRTLNEKDYEGAKKLAADFSDSINVDVVLKREWRDICTSDSVTVESVNDILRQISQEKWIAEACATCSSSSIDAQKALCELGSSLSAYEVPATRVQLLHNARILSACTDIGFYLEHRSKSLLGVAFQLAQTGDLIGLQRLLERNFTSLESYILDITSLIPPATAPNRFEWLLPGSDIRIDQVPDSSVEELAKLSAEPEYAHLVREITYGEEAVEPRETDYLTWIRKRAVEIEADTGLFIHSISLLEIAIDNEHTELRPDLAKWHHFSTFVCLCLSVNDSFTNFCSLSVSQLVSALSHIAEADLVRHAGRVLSLIESVASTTVALRSAVRPLLLASCERSSKVLRVFREKRPEAIDKELVTDCLCELPHTGKALLDDMRALGVSPELCSAQRALLDLNVKPTFKRLLDSTSDPTTARSLLMQSVANIRPDSAISWEAMKDEVLLLGSSIYSKMVPQEEVLVLLAKELLLSEFGQRDMGVLKSILTLTKNGPRESDGIKLGWQKSGEVLLSLSTDVMNEAVGKNDAMLDKSRFFAHLAKDVSPKLSGELRKLLDALELMYELGSTILPASVKHREPMQLLKEIIDLGANYKQGKKCAKLAVLLGIPNSPVATALSLASLAAIAHHDEDCLAKYISEIIKAARDIPVVHQLCIEIIQSSYVPSVLEDVYACALLNCPEEQLVETMETIEESRRKRRIDFPTFCRPTADIVPDICSVRADSWTKPAPLSDDTRFSLRNVTSSMTPREAACIWSRESAATAVAMALLADEKEANRVEWTENDVLQRYEQALRHFGKKLSPGLVEQLSPKFLIAKYNQEMGNDNPLDRIEAQGVSRERFICDAAYREDTLLGLAMEEDDAIFSDALSLANQFHVDVWKLHMTSLENALTSCPLPEAKRILKSRSHLATLRTDTDRFHASLRKDVLPLIETNEVFIAYLSLFAEDQPEKAASPTLKQILDKKRNLSAKKMFTNAGELTKVVVTIPDKYIISWAPGLRKFPAGVEACETTARALLNGIEESHRPPSSVLALSALLGDDEAALIDLIASKPVDEEITYLQTAAMIVDATPNAPERLGQALKERIEILTSAENVPVYSEPAQTSILTSRRKH